MGTQVSRFSAVGELVGGQSGNVSYVPRNHLLRFQLVVFGVFVGMFVFLVASASAAVVPAAPSLRVTTAAFPTVAHPGVGKKGKYAIAIENVGGVSTSGEITIKDVLPEGLTVQSTIVQPGGSCHPGGSSEEVCTTNEDIPPDGFLVVSIFVSVSSPLGPEPLVNRVSVSGGNAPPAADETNQRVGAEHDIGPAGVSEYSFEETGPAGESVTQAGAHPTFLTTSLLLNNIYATNSNEPAKPVQAAKDLVFYLPLGLLGNPTVSALCPASLVEISSGQTDCPPSSRVGTIAPLILSTLVADTPDLTHEFGLYNVVPEKGYAAEFAFASLGYTFFIYATVVRHDGTYMLRISTPGLPAVAGLVGLVATFYGDIKEQYVSGFEEATLDRGSFLTDPTDCVESTGAREASVEMNTWENPDPSLPFTASTSAFPALEGCELLKFSPRLSVTPETTQADEPSSYQVGLEVPQAPLDASGLGTPPVKNVEIKLPDGTTISPSSANGLQGCEEVGSSGINIEGPEAEAPAADGLQHVIAGHCPAASEIGTVTASTPLLREGLTGHLFLATPHCGGAGQRECSETDAQDGELFGLFLEMEAPNAGVIIKLKGAAHVDPTTGRITAIFDEAPQFPFNQLTVTMKQGPRAPLANSQSCGVASTEGVIAPWSEPITAPVATGSSFGVDWNGAGAACPASLPFAPSFTAGTTSPAAGAYSAFSLTLKREDREQNIASITSTLPKGLLAAVSKVGRCPEPQASQASLTACPASSLIGSTSVGVGSGSEPYYVTGKVFFTGPYGGAPFGLSVVVPAAAGPFNLGNVLVRVALFVDPHTAQVTAVSGPLPQKLDGVPLRIRTLNVSLDAHEFVLNPTNCSQLSITGVIHSATGTNASVASPFAASGCKKLAFKPSLSASTKGKTSKAGGASLTIRVGSGAGQANISKVRLVFPKQLPARLTTLQKACTENQFNTNPAGCPAGSVIGTATAHTAILKSALTGPIYLVSHGGAAFPDAVVVLQGEGVLLYLDGNTNIKKGITTSTFNSIPDAPISTFQATLPQGAHSAFATDIPTKAKGNLCGQSLTLPATITGQNGAQITQNTKISVSGCPKAKKKAKSKEGKRRRSRKKK